MDAFFALVILILLIFIVSLLSDYRKLANHYEKQQQHIVQLEKENSEHKRTTSSKLSDDCLSQKQRLLECCQNQQRRIAELVKENRRYEAQQKELQSQVNELAQKEMFLGVTKFSRDKEMDRLEEIKVSAERKADEMRINAKQQAVSIIEDAMQEARNIQNIADQAHQELSRQKEFVEQSQKALEAIINEKAQSRPELANYLADLQYLLDLDRANQLLLTSPPAVKSKVRVQEIASEKRMLTKQNKQLQYQLDFFEQLFPWLEDFKEIPSDEAVSYASETFSTEYESVQKWLSPAEYQELSNSEKFQLALERWKNRKKTDWDVGIEYERYIGYRLECEGYKVTYSGASLGLNDMGRDLLATKDGVTLVIQCKRWAKEKTIHEKHIFQLYGSTAVLSVEKPNQIYKPVFVTTATLSDTARKCAEYCGIALVENCPIGDYPLIKCNFNKNGEKIYHLPFDQQYDRVVVNKNDQCFFAWTTEEAEAAGFRRAFRWHSNS